MNINANGWIKPLLAALIPLITAAVAFGVLKGTVNEQGRSLERKADAAVVTAQNDALLRELTAIRDDIRQLREELRRR